MFQRLKLYEAITSSSSVVQLKLKCWRKKPLHDDIIEEKKVYIQLAFVRYKRMLVWPFLSPSVYIQRCHGRPDALLLEAEGRVQ